MSPHLRAPRPLVAAISAMATLVLMTTMTGCGGGGGGAESGSIATPLDDINSSSYSLAIGIGANSLTQAAGMVAAGSVPLHPAFKEVTLSSYPCALGGSLGLSMAGADRVFSAQNCKTAKAWLVSGTLIEKSGVSSPYAVNMSFQDLNYRIGDSDTTTQNLRGGLGITVNADGSTKSAGAILYLNRNGRSYDYSLELSENGNWSVAIESASFPARLVTTWDIKAKSVKIRSRHDGSSVSYTESADGKSYTVELTSKAQTQSLTKTISKVELEALIKAASML